MGNNLPFKKINYIIMIIGIVTLVLGYYIMTQDEETYGFGTKGLTVGPVLAVLGFIIEVVAIMYRPKNNTEEEAPEE